SRRVACSTAATSSVSSGDVLLNLAPTARRHAHGWWTRSSRQRRFSLVMSLQGKRLAFIGGGTMAEAMIRGVLDKHLVPPSHVFVTGPRRERRAELTKQFGVKALALNAEAAEGAHVVVLSVKPQILPTVLRELRGKLRADQLVVSIVAGAPLAVLREGLDHATIVRAMPNTPAQIGMGITAWCATSNVERDQRDRAKAILGALGEEIEVEEEGMVDMATALS